ncbi:orotate phosphoribosyltransferase [Dickeya fangzhongdai]|uniref:Orotate phosphoribosyltransferase n=1 Tax=Dickeya fangzhongdai TaxID=1778540 RepID=A0A2K8QQL1_9GAMM|nr:orotate phosphoribosyltransferase [Dickeya fangzhongdai]ATZ95807.1 orotate phosphoribosyltransferase [Dickeya fangzhongdai]QOH49251.1 orotate phosphoribosyltransferase [Dickeya fangzhongdai]QOH53554.1 orotate phosphoribosyltransferase [Dickeya fangzhongdai]ULR30432.1 orotate phosphoribosyltransferase [Dickeya fangzhongdai]WOX99245.1 orotate phosphoribosyltransferase [Dickeya fangzhongdai]
MSDLSARVAKFIVDAEIIIFGDFTLKSKRQSPYFFNFSRFSSAEKLNTLANFYAEYILRENISANIIYGPAYKGIPLAIATALALSGRKPGISYVFNRKEAKQYGDGGITIGADIANQPLIVLDDVMTSGKTVAETRERVTEQQGVITDYIVAIDRQEADDSGRYALESVRQENTFRVSALTTIADILQVMRQRPQHAEQVRRMEAYLSRYCQ